MGLGLVDKPHLQRFKDKLDEYFVKKTDKGTSSNFGVVKVDGSTITSNNGVITAVGGGSEVEWTQTQSSGTKIAEIDIGGTSQDVYAPTPTTVVANPQDSGTEDLTKLQVGSTVYDVTGVSDFSGLSDVSINTSTLTNGQVPKWNSSTSKWENADESGGGGSSTLAGLTDTDITTPSDSQELVYNNTSSKWQNKTTRIELTKAEYDALSYAEKHNGCMYYITDAGHTSNFTPIGLGDCYSEEEKMIGCWTDGKPLYAKTFEFDSTDLQSDTYGKYIDLTINNIEKVCLSTVVLEDGMLELTYYQSSTLFITSFPVLSTNKCTFKFRYGSDVASYLSDYFVNSKIILYYTKTTDTAGSGTWTPSGALAIHYSTNEQIIGTWIDGKTLYQKTWELTVPNASGTYMFSETVENLDKVIESNYTLWGIGERGYVPWYNSATILFSEQTASHIEFYFASNTYAGNKIYYTSKYTKTS